MSSRPVAFFAHNPAHRLLPVSGDGDAKDEKGSEFTCDGCLVAGARRRYRCGHPGCGFTIHEACAERGFPRKLKSAVHPQHRLRRRREAAAGCECEVCGEAVKGACYGCVSCGGVAVHPMCARMPGSARGPAHAGGGHDAWLVRVDRALPPSSTSPPAPSSATVTVPAWPWPCAACGRPVTGAWRYRCVTCREDLHPRCLVPATDQCRAADAEGQQEAPLMSSCCSGLLHDITRCLATTGTAQHYRGYYNGA